MIDRIYQRYTVECKQLRSGPYALVNVLPFIFDHFYRVRNEDIKGDGPGLAIVKSIVEQHGGQVSVESAPASGTCFSVSPPLLSLAKPGKNSVLANPAPKIRRKPAQGVLA